MTKPKKITPKESRKIVDNVKLLKKQEACPHDKKFRVSSHVAIVKNNDGKIVRRILSVSASCAECEKEFYIPNGAVPMISGSDALPVKDVMVRTDSKTLLIPVI